MRNAETVLVVTEKRVQPQLGLENTGKPDDAKVSCPVWGGAEGKGLLTQYLASGLLHQGFAAYHRMLSLLTWLRTGAGSLV